MHKHWSDRFAFLFDGWGLVLLLVLVIGGITLIGVLAGADSRHVRPADFDYLRHFMR